MLRKEFKTWPANPLPNTILITVDIYVINLGYLKDRPSCFMKFLNSSIEKSDRILVKLNIAAVIPETDN